MTEEIIEQYKKQNKPIKVNIACGQIKMDGFIGIDKEKTEAADIVQNLETYPWPFENNSVDEIVCSHYVEHVRDLIPFIDEMYRIMKKPCLTRSAKPHKNVGND